jgi:hypothetical protein
MNNQITERVNSLIIYDAQFLAFEIAKIHELQQILLFFFYGSTALVGLGRFFQFPNLYTPSHHEDEELEDVHTKEGAIEGNC